MELQSLGLLISNALFALGASLLIWTVWKAWVQQSSTKKLALPPGLPTWPILGSLPFLPGDVAPTMHKYFAQLSRKYGPVFHFRLGCLPMVVVNSVESMEELFKSKDLDFAHRAGSTVFRIMSKELGCNGSNFIYQPYTPRYRFLRKVATTKLLTVSRVNSFMDFRTSAQVAMVEAIEATSKAGDDVQLREVLTTTSMKIISQMCFGDRYCSADSKLADVMRDFMDMLEQAVQAGGRFYITDVIPALRWLDPLLYEPELRRINKLRSSVFGRMLNDHRSGAGNQKQPDFMDTLLSFEGDEKMSEDAISGALLDILGGATDTSATTVEWTMIELIRNPGILAKLQAEIDSVVGHERCVEESDLPNLHYLQAVVKETFRMHPPVPLLIPRSNMEESSLGGYRIPKGSTIFVNVWAVGHDSSVWEAPEEFRPERFLNSQVNVFGSDCQLLPFGAGRRGCPGIHLGLVVVQRNLAILVHAFDWSPPLGMKPTDVSNEEKIHFMLKPLTPLVASAIPRRTMSLYEGSRKHFV